jgi:hypothetical protein
MIDRSGRGGKVDSRSGVNAMHTARQRRGGIRQELMEYSREQARMRQKIGEALKHGPLTVPEIHSATGIPADRIFWYLMAWKKYGKILESEPCEDYFKYSLAKEPGK